MLANSMDRAKPKSNVITLAAFDLKGAFNDVSKTSLEARRWINSVIKDRTASIGSDDIAFIPMLE